MKMRGFTLLEVLVSLLVTLLGLMGVAGLMIKGKRANFEASQSQQALVLASDMAERIRANPGAAALYVSKGLGASPQTMTKNCAAPMANCSAAERAAFELVDWNNRLTGNQETFANPDTAITGNVGGALRTRGCVEDLGGNTYRVSVAWQGDVETVAPTQNCGIGLYGVDTRRRLVSLTVVVCPSTGGPLHRCM